MRRSLAAVAAFALSAFAADARAGLLLDRSPGAGGRSYSIYVNQSDSFNIADSFGFAGPTILTGMDIYTDVNSGVVGGSVTVRLRSDAAGVPSALLNDFTATISAIDADGVGGITRIHRVHAEFSSPLDLLGGMTYWIGMSGTGYNLGQVILDGLDAPQDRSFYAFSGSGPGSPAPFGDMSFRLYGDATPAAVATPEPGALVLAASGLPVAIGLWLRRRKAKVAA